MRWQVAINFKGNLQLLRGVLERISAGLVEEDGQLFLTSAEFEVLERSEDVHTNATRIASVINEASFDELVSGIGFSLGGLVVEQIADGPRRTHHVICIEAVEMSDTCHVVAVVTGALPEDERRRIEAELKEQEYQRSRQTAISRVRSAYLDPRARRVLQLLNGDLDTPALWHIYEIIQDDMGEAIKGLASLNKVERFTRSMNSSEVLGDKARHALPKRQPPRNPMHLEEARQFIRALADRWMEHKAGLNGST